MVGLVGDPDGRHKGLRKGLMIVHGTTLLLIFVAGFGMMARKGIGIGAANTGWPGWIFGKIGIWLVFAALATFIKRNAGLGRQVFWIVTALGGAAAYLAIVHPGG